MGIARRIRAHRKSVRVIICLDFDGVIHDTSTVPKGRKMGRPVKGAGQAVYDLQKAGHTVVIHTSRVQQESQLGHVYDWLAYFGFYQIEVCLAKPPADVYVDDKGLRFTGWENRTGSTLWALSGY